MKQANVRFDEGSKKKKKKKKKGDDDDEDEDEEEEESKEDTTPKFDLSGRGDFNARLEKDIKDRQDTIKKNADKSLGKLGALKAAKTAVMQLKMEGKVTEKLSAGIENRDLMKLRKAIIEAGGERHKSQSRFSSIISNAIDTISLSTRITHGSLAEAFEDREGQARRVPREGALEAGEAA